MRWEEIESQQIAEEEVRKEGIAKISRFLQLAVGKEDISDPQVFLEYFKGLDFEGFVKALETINGILKQIPGEQREVLQKHSRVIEGGDEDWVNWAPVNPEVGKEILEQTFDKLQEQAKEGDPAIGQHLALTLYNSVIYLHLFPDGNGRTARALYFLTSPRIEKHKDTFYEHLNQVVSSRSKSIGEYHHQLNMGSFLLELQDRGISQEYDEQEKDYCAQLRSSKLAGYDISELGYLATVDVLSDEQKKQYGHTCRHGDVFSYRLEEFPEDVQHKITERQRGVRREVTEGIIEASMAESDWPDHLMGPMDEAFKYQPVK